MRFNHIISIGYFCSVASELERKGFREFSSPFDWTIVDLDTVTDLILIKFKNLFICSQLFSQKIPQYHVVGHRKFNISFYHDFKKRADIKSQLEKVRSKYARRAKRLFTILNSQDAILFVRYVSEEPRNKDTKQKINRFIKNIKKIHWNFRVLLIGHQSFKIDLKENNMYILDCIRVSKDKNDLVARSFFNNEACYKNFRRMVQYSMIKRIKNLYFYYKKRKNVKS